MENFTFKPVAAGLILGLLTLLGGEMHGLAFGAKEDSIKTYFSETARANAASIGSEEKVNKATAGAWKYLKRAHEHYMGLGTAAVALTLVTGLAAAPAVAKTVVSTAVGLGALLYPLFWTLTSVRTAAMGAHAAKESLSLLAQAGAGLSFLGLLGVIALVVLWLKGGSEQAG